MKASHVVIGFESVTEFIVYEVEDLGQLTYGNTSCTWSTQC